MIAMDECQFLQGADLSQRIREICAADAVDCAVAFWGRDMRHALFPDWSKQTVRIVCDIAMQGTPRSALEQLDAPNNPNLTVHDGLHAKLFISASGAVIGSANASDNGVGKESGFAGKLLEAGLFCPPRSKAFEDAKAFFENLFDVRKQVRQADLERAAIKSREPRLPVTSFAGMSLLKRLRKHPETFAEMTIAIANEDMDLNVARSRLSTYNEEHASELTLNNVFLQADAGAVAAIRRAVLLFYKPSEHAKGQVSGYVDAVPYPHRKPDIVIGRKHWPTFAKKVGHPDMTVALSDKEWKVISKIMKGDDWLFTPEAFSELLQQNR